MVEDRVTKSKLEHYLNLTKMAREKATRIPLDGTTESIQLDILLRMADDYASDAKHFMDTGDFVRAFGAINYAHAWICLLYTSPSPRDLSTSRMPSSA